MGIDIGLPPVVTLLIALLVLAILSDFLLELFSIRMSQATGRWQVFLFDHVGDSAVFDFIIANLFQFLSFRKKGFLLQFSSLVNVGSFTKKQSYMLLLGSFVGFGLSATLLFPISLVAGGSLCLLSFVLTLFWKDQVRDFGVALLAWGLLLTLFSLFDRFLETSTLNIQYLHLNEAVSLGLVFLLTLCFRTPLPFLIGMSVLHKFFGINISWLPVLFLIHALMTSFRFYWQFFQDRKRLIGCLINAALFQAVQFAVGMGFVIVFRRDIALLSGVSSFVEALQFSIISYVIYNAGTLLIMFPFLFLANWWPTYDRSEEKKAGSQKIINNDQRGQCFSIHLSLFLLRQEFKKYTTSVHTIFKLSRESDHVEEAVNQKFVRYQGMLVRVGDELKELCFSIGRQRSYRWQVKEVMSYYKIVNQLELLVDDLSLVAASLRLKGIDESYEKECRFWLGLQLKLFESYFNDTLGVGRDEPEKVKANMDKSYEVLDRFFNEKKNIPVAELSSKTFYRITESIGSLAL